MHCSRKIMFDAVNVNANDMLATLTKYRSVMDKRMYTTMDDKTDSVLQSHKLTHCVLYNQYNEQQKTSTDNELFINQIFSQLKTRWRDLISFTGKRHMLGIFTDMWPNLSTTSSLIRTKVLLLRHNSV